MSSICQSKVVFLIHAGHALQSNMQLAAALEAQQAAAPMRNASWPPSTKSVAIESMGPSNSHQNPMLSRQALFAGLNPKGPGKNPAHQLLRPLKPRIQQTAYLIVSISSNSLYWRLQDLAGTSSLMQMHDVKMALDSKCSIVEVRGPCL